ncbi:trypsin-like peptidase domain-containing protein [Candidatus Berkiella aquae]|uniref:Putative serine protease HtrA n=1 Tax=Candidatus Berkiella aquae TaxID=295108 RepID=A0A0Q9YMZ5_9GAMM|nr:S1C family serine protease [Candidatus Berkiella aquae]MCS5712647.1 trypsin-like peptidase domain-containing protein [Candidatus Berkiella aquae]
MGRNKASSSSDKQFAVKIYTTALDYDYQFPWKSPTISRWTGSGFVIEGNKIITNAHVAGGSTFVEVELANDSIKYAAKLMAVNHECDLAMLEVEDESFWQKAKSLEIGETPTQLQKIAVHGFPIGGEGYCITTGKVSRIENDWYAHGEQMLLSTQVSAPINPGNSGGAAVDKENKVVGVVHQSLTRGQNIGYMIPANILKHFIEQVRTNNMGFPSLNLDIQKMENRFLREKYGMKEHQTGIVIRSIPPMSCVKDKLQEDDVILKLNDHYVNNDGTVNLESITRVDYRYLINSSKLGDEMVFTVLREGKKCCVKVDLTDTFDSTHTMISRTHGQPPSYCIIAGSVVVQPVSKNLQTDWGRSYTNQVKKHKNEQILVINTLLKNRYSQGYEGLAGEIIDSVNGVEVHTMQELVKAVTENTQKNHLIETRSGKQLVIPKLSIVEANELLRAYDIEHDCSADLKTTSEADTLLAELTHHYIRPLQFSESGDSQLPIAASSTVSMRENSGYRCL